MLAFGIVGCSRSKLDTAAAEQMCRTVSHLGHSLTTIVDVSDHRLSPAANNAVAILKGEELDSIVAATEAGMQVEGLRQDTVLWFQGVNAGGSRTEGRDSLSEAASTLWRELECDRSSAAPASWLE